MMRFSVNHIVRSVVFCAIVAGTGAAYAQNPPLKGALSGDVTIGSPGSPNTIAGTGLASHWGRFTIHAAHTYTSPIDFAGNMTIVTASGDQVVATYVGMSTFTFLPSGQLVVGDKIVATIDPLHSTGRFRGATGQFAVNSHTLVDSPSHGFFAAELDGAIHYSH